MLTPEDRAALEQVRDAKEQRRQQRWETQVVRQAFANGATGPEIGAVLGVTKQDVQHIRDREFANTEPSVSADDVSPGDTQPGDTAR